MAHAVRLSETKAVLALKSSGAVELQLGFPTYTLRMPSLRTSRAYRRYTMLYAMTRQGIRSEDSESHRKMNLRMSLRNTSRTSWRDTSQKYALRLTSHGLSRDTTYVDVSTTQHSKMANSTTLKTSATAVITTWNRRLIRIHRNRASRSRISSAEKPWSRGC
jgi:hypothetical protein